VSNIFKKSDIGVMVNTQRMMTKLRQMRFSDQETETANSCAITLEV